MRRAEVWLNLTVCSFLMKTLGVKAMAKGNDSQIFL